MRGRRSMPAALAGEVAGARRSRPPPLSQPPLAGMRDEPPVGAAPANRARLEAVVADRNSPQKHVWRARIVLAAAEGLGTVEITRRVGVSKLCVRRWRARFAAGGGAGFLRGKTPPP